MSENFAKIADELRGMFTEQLELRAEDEDIMKRQGKVITELTDKIIMVNDFLDSLFQDAELSKLFRSDLIELRCKLCNISECSVRGDRYECLRLNSDIKIIVKENKEQE
jgi:hypothetical protein